MTHKRVREIPFDKQAESYQIYWRKKYNLAKGKWGWQNGVQREHILPASRWLLGVWQPIRNPLDEYVRVSGIQPNTGKHNLKSSWTQCANLFFLFRYYPDMKRIFAGFLSQQLDLRVTDIEALEFEYAAPGNLEPRRLLGEVGGMRGSMQTSPDVAVLFGCEDGKSGIYLIENKYIEHSFYNCSGAEKTQSKMHSKRGLPPNDYPERCLDVVGVFRNPEKMCQQEAWHRKYWSILGDTVNEQFLNTCGHCPALTGGYQLFRQQALAQGIVESGLFDYVVSGVAYDCRNDALISCLRKVAMSNFVDDWPQLFNTSVKFHCFTHQDLVSYVKQSTNSTAMKWAKYVTERYGYN